jgi:glycosyltransferase involved in cell wall biosynthesis
MFQLWRPLESVTVDVAAPGGRDRSGEISARLRDAGISVIIPALNEEDCIGDVVRAVPRPPATEIIVIDNGSDDRTTERTQAAGARVIGEPVRGYGRACQAGVRALSPDCGVVVFLDGDGSNCPELLPLLVGRILNGEYDFMIGSRLRGVREPGSMNLPQIVAGRLAGFALRALYGVRYTDMCPFRAIRRDALEGLAIREETYGWNLEMQMQAARDGLKILEVPVNHRRRTGGASKVSGNPAGTLKGSVRLIATIARIALERRGPAQ